MPTPAHAYETAENLRDYLTQATDASNELLTEILQRATGIIDSYLQAGGCRDMAFLGYEIATKEIYQVAIPSLPFLTVPAHEFGSVSSIVFGEPDEEELGDWRDISTRQLYRLQGWPFDQGFRVMANWGYGDPPLSIRQICLELAVNIWRSKDRGLFTEIIGVQGGGGIKYIGGLTRQQADIINNIRCQYEVVAL